MAKLTADEFFKLPNPKRPDRRKVLLDAISMGTSLEVILSGKTKQDFRLSNLKVQMEKIIRYLTLKNLKNLVVAVVVVEVQT